jgi:hypothetical protein
MPNTDHKKFMAKSFWLCSMPIYTAHWEMELTSDGERARSSIVYTGFLKGFTYLCNTKHTADKRPLSVFFSPKKCEFKSTNLPSADQRWRFIGGIGCSFLSNYDIFGEDRSEEKWIYTYLNYRRNEEKRFYLCLNYRRNEEKLKYLFLNYRRKE